MLYTIVRTLQNLPRTEMNRATVGRLTEQKSGMCDKYHPHYARWDKQI
jgi:hypothetical protein